MRKHNAAPPVGVYINDNRRLNVLELGAHVPREDALPACNRVPLEQRLHDLLGALKADARPVVMRACAKATSLAHCNALHCSTLLKAISGRKICH